MHKGKEDYYKIKSNWVLERRFNCRLVFQDTPGVVGKILYTCNCLIIDLWILGSGALNSPGGVFCLARGFSHFSTNHRI